MVWYKSNRDKKRKELKKLIRQAKRDLKKYRKKLTPSLLTQINEALDEAKRSVSTEDFQSMNNASVRLQKILGSPKIPRKSTLREYAEAFIFAIILALIIRAFVIQAFKIPTGSMEDTLLVGDFLLVNKFIYGAQVPFTDYRLPAIRQPARGDIIVFKYPKDPTRDFIKRCIAVDGDTLEIRNKVVYINGEPIDEPYVKHEDPNIQGSWSPRDNYGPIVIPENYLFMMGDNRDNSSDSRMWGLLDKRLIKGKALIIYFSWGGNHIPRLTRIGNIIR